MSGMGDPLVNVAHRLLRYMVVYLYQKKLTQTILYPKPRGPIESSPSRAHAKAERPQDLPQKIKTFEHVYQSRKKGIRKKTVPRTKGKKQKRLTGHTTAMDFVVQTSGHRMVPRQRFSPISQLFMRTSTEHGAQTFLAHWEVVQQLQHIKQDRNRYRVQHNRLQRAHHFDSHTEQNWNELHQVRVGFYRLFPRT